MDKKALITISEWQWPDDISDKERTFIGEYVLSGDKQASATAAGYADSVLDHIGDKLLRKSSVRREIAEIRSAIEKKAGDLSDEDVIAHFKAIAEANILDFYDELGNVVDIDEMDKTKAGAVKEIIRSVSPKGVVTVKVTMHDKIAALQNLSRIRGLYAADNGQTQGDINIQINVPGISVL